jgi:FG-GAP-like repeat
MKMKCSRVIVGSLVSGVALAATGLAQDFNGNTVRDAVDLRAGVSQDCNRNGVPDEADLGKPDFAAAIEHHNDTASTSNVSGVAMVDVDLDGDMDVVAAARSGQNDSSLTIWRNDGGPGLVFGTRYIVPNALCYLIRPADLNADGRTDLVVSDSGFPGVLVVLATGPGTFGPATRLTAGSRSTGIAAGDLDNDGDIDIAMPGFANNLVEVFRNNGNGTFAPRTTYACGQQPVGAAIGDFTGDGLADIAVANSFISAPGSGTVTLLRNIGGGSFTLHATLPIAGHPESSANSSPHDLWLRDINADGDADLLVSSKDSNSLRIFSNDGVGAFTNTQTLGPLDAVGAVADRLVCTNLDADPAPELAWCDSLAKAVRVYDNDAGTFVFSQAYAAGSEGPIDIAAGDLTGDGKPDLALAGHTSYAFSTMVNQGGLNFDSVTHIKRPGSNFYPLLADFTGDGITDLASYSTSTMPANFNIAPGIGNNRFGPSLLIPMSTGGTILPRDINHDGHLDILSIGGHCIVKLSNGDGTFGPEINSGVAVLSGSRHPQTADINNDGNLDLLWTRRTASNEPHFINISLGNGQGQFAPSYEIITPPFFGSLWTGDLSGDGFPELFGSVAAGIVGPIGLETVLVYPNNGDGTFGDYVVHAHELEPNFAGTPGAFAWVDLDNDGDNDLIAQSNRFFLYRNTHNQLDAPVMLGGFVNYTFSNFTPTIFDADLAGDLLQRRRRRVRRGRHRAAPCRHAISRRSRCHRHRRRRQQRAARHPRQARGLFRLVSAPELRFPRRRLQLQRRAGFVRHCERLVAGRQRRRRAGRMRSGLRRRRRGLRRRRGFGGSVDAADGVRVVQRRCGLQRRCGF